MVASRIVSRLARFIICKGALHYSILGPHLGNKDTLFSVFLIQFRLYLIAKLTAVHLEFKGKERLLPAV